MNTYKKYCENVFVAKCTEEHKKGDVITVQSGSWKKHECIVYNFLGKGEEGETTVYYYSIVRCDGYNSQKRAKSKAETLEMWADKATQRGVELVEESKEYGEAYVPGEPIKDDHYSKEKYYRLFKRKNKKMSKATEEFEKAESHREKIKYWKGVSMKIDLSMPESLGFFKEQYEKAVEYHRGLKGGTIGREHSHSLRYALEKVKKLEDKYRTAVKLWGVTPE